MAVYPGFGTLADSTCTTLGGQEPARASNGMLRVRRLWPDTRREWNLRHVLTPTERDILEALYLAERDADVAYLSPWDRVGYTVRFVAPPVYTPRGQHYEARVQLAQAY